MAKVQLHAGVTIDTITKDEMKEVMSHETDRLLADLEGVKYLRFIAQGAINSGAVTIPSQVSGAQAQLQIPDLGPQDGFSWLIQRITVDGLKKYGVVTVNSPAVPASGTAVNNPYPFPVQVVISGGVGLTAVVVNGVTVGTGDGTYLVPAGGTISVSYSTTAPTWVWSALANQNIYTIPDYLIIYRNMVVGNNRIGSVSSGVEWFHLGSKGIVLLGGDTLIITNDPNSGIPLQSTGVLTVNGEVVQVPQVQLGKLIH